MISIQYQPNDDFELHQDLTLTITEIGLEQVADSYYVHIDDFYEVATDNENKTISVLIILLTFWLQKVKASIINKSFYLPFDYADEWTGCIRIKRVDDENIEINYGHTSFEGWRTYPSKADDFMISDSDYNPEKLSAIIPIKQFDIDINKSIALLEKQR